MTKRQPRTDSRGGSASSSIVVALLVGAAAIAACQEETVEANPPLPARVMPAPPPAPPPLPDASIWEVAQADPELERGRVVWTGTCIDCHSTGLGGAPLIGNERLWAPRLAQGIETLVRHATKGFYGDVGEMPARGGNEALSDEDVRAAVRFMASRAGPIPTEAADAGERFSPPSK